MTFAFGGQVFAKEFNDLRSHLYSLARTQIQENSPDACEQRPT